MLASVEGAQMVPYKQQNVILELTHLYFHPTEAFKAQAQAILSKKNVELEGKEIALSPTKTEADGMDVYLVEEGADITDADLVGHAPLSAVYKLVPNYSYRVAAPTITSVSTSGEKGGVTMDLGTVYGYGNKYEGVKPRAAKAHFDRTSSASKKYPIALIGDATMENLAGNKFIASNNNKGVTFFAVEVEGKLKAVAKSLVSIPLKEGVRIELDAQASDFTGELTLYVYGSAKK
jgi:hypothetical protein